MQPQGLDILHRLSTLEREQEHEEKEKGMGWGGQCPASPLPHTPDLSGTRGCRAHGSC